MNIYFACLCCSSYICSSIVFPLILYTNQLNDYNINTLTLNINELNLYLNPLYVFSLYLNFDPIYAVFAIIDIRSACPPKCLFNERTKFIFLDINNNYLGKFMVCCINYLIFYFNSCCAWIISFFYTFLVNNFFEL